MQYLGGKQKHGKAIAAVLRSYLGSHTAYVEPFCGAAGVLQYTSDWGVRRYASDANPEIIALWQALQRGWSPPTDVSAEEYQRVKHDSSAPPELRAFVGFGCSFGGKLWGGYAKGNPDNGQPSYAQSAYNALTRKLCGLHNVEFHPCPYQDVKPRNALVYCDPPYAGTVGWRSFDSGAFWHWAESLDGCTVLVSEYTAPAGWVCVWRGVTLDGIRQGINAQSTRSVERLWSRKPVEIGRKLLELKRLLNGNR